METTYTTRKYKKVKFLTTLRDGPRTTHYFYYPQDKVIVPINTFSKRKFERGPRENREMVKTLKKILLAVNVCVLGIRIYMFHGGNFYTYLLLSFEDKILEINTDMETAMVIAHSFDSQVYIKKNIMQNLGIKVTKELIERSLYQ